MKVEVTFREIEQLLAPSMDSPIHLEYIGLNCVKVKYSHFSVKVNIQKIEGYRITLAYELDSFKNFALKISNYFFNFKDKVNPNIYQWDLKNKTVEVNLFEVDEFSRFRKYFIIRNVLINSVGIFVYFNIQSTDNATVVKQDNKS